jgi:hypothetical protein
VIAIEYIAIYARIDWAEGVFDPQNGDFGRSATA